MNSQESAFDVIRVASKSDAKAVYRDLVGSIAKDSHNDAVDAAVGICRAIKHPIATMLAEMIAELRAK